jgi:hypothetical protein
VARPDQPLAKLQSATLVPIKIQREKTIGQPAENRRGEHVTDQECRGPKTGLTILIGITRQKFVLERRQDRRQYVAINVIKKVDSEQKRQGTGGGGFFARSS